MIVATVPEPVAVAEQVVNPLTRVMAGVGGTAKPAEKVTVIVSPPASAPVDVAEKLAVQVAFALAASDVLLTVTAVGVPAAASAGVVLAAVESLLVASVSAEATAGFVIPAIVKVIPVVPGATKQLPPVSARVIVTT